MAWPSRGARWEPQAERDRGRRAWGCELDEAEPVHRRDVIVEPPTQLLVEPLGPVDVSHGDDVVFELHRDAGTSLGLMALSLAWFVGCDTSRRGYIASGRDSASPSASQSKDPASELTLVPSRVHDL